MKTMMNKQCGVSLGGTLIVLVLLIAAGISAMKVLPSYMENMTIKKIFDRVAKDPEMQGATIRQIRESYGKGAIMNNIHAVSEADIEITLNPVVLSASYSVKIPLVSNASLLLEFNTSSSSQ